MHPHHCIVSQLQREQQLKQVPTSGGEGATTIEQQQQQQQLKQVPASSDGDLSTGDASR